MVKASGAAGGRRSGPAGWVLAGLGPLAAAAALAQGTPAPGSAALPAMASAAAGAPFAVKGFRIEGDNPLSQAEADSILAPYVRGDSSLENLQQATSALEAAFRARGFGLYRVALPPQALGDTVRLQVLRFSIAKVEVTGATLYGADNVRRSLPELKEGESPNLRRLAVQTAIANENGNKQVQVGLRESDTPDRIDAAVSVREKKPWNLSVGLANSGTRESGRDRLSLAAGHTNLFGLDHQAQLAYTTSLERPEDVKQFGLSYRVPLYAVGAAVGLSYTRSDVVGNFGSFTSTGAGHTLGVLYTHYLPPDGGYRGYVNLGLDDKLFKGAEINGVPVGVDRRSRPLSVGYAARMESDSAVVVYNLDLSANLGSGEANDIAAWQQEDPRISAVRFSVLRGGGAWVSPGARWQWTLRGQFQYSPDVLISGEQFGLGGQASVRGTRFERPITGDKGLSGSFELATPELAPGLRALGFADAGWLWNNSPNGTTHPSSDRLGSLGVGLRYQREPLVLSADYGRLVTGSRVPVSVNAAAPQKGDDRFYVNLMVRF